MRGSWQNWWWVVFCCLCSFGLYFHAVKDKQEQIRALSFRLDTMKKEKFYALSEGESLRLQIDSQTDPSWIEMILMRDLGVVPEGWIKVHFKR